jgi:hypothetical protein
MEPVTKPEEAVRGTCQKCGRPFRRLGKWYEDHQAKCDGAPWKLGAPAKKRSPPAAAAPPSALDSTLQECQRAEDALGREIMLVKVHLDRLMKEAAAIAEVKRKILEAKTA